MTAETIEDSPAECIVDETMQRHDSPRNSPSTSSEGGEIKEQDLRDIWRWNENVSPAVEGRVHDIIAQKARQKPEAVAICAWDGRLLYGELEELSIRLAHYLVGIGVGSGVIIPLCFEKSKWMPVAQMGVMKAGGASIAMDIALPLRRLQQIVDQAGSSICLCSRENETLARRLNFERIVRIDDRDMQLLETSTSHLPEVSPSALVFITYTSGSTGVPKGACISHANVCAAVHYQGSKLGFHANSRVLDFAPYSFDVAWSNVLHTLCAGGCLCIASRDEMLNDVENCIATFDVTLINITPTMFATLTPRKSTLEVVLLSGERPNGHTLVQWSDKVEVKNTYGPAECTFKSAFASIPCGGRLSNIHIGRGVGNTTWIVDPTNHDRLVPIGQPGELLLEGPLVGQGYLNDPAQTAAAFIEDPAWLLEGRPSVPGRRGRLYKTGDIVQYNQDGTVQFVGRKDAQVKIRGQRVELGEVEYHVHRSLTGRGVGLSIVAEVITPRGSANAMLVAFVAVGDGIQDKQAVVQEATRGLDEELASVVPAYMIPSAYIPIGRVPLTVTGKTDRRQLREEAWSLEQLAALHRSKDQRRMPDTPLEMQLQQLWASVLGVPAASIGKDDSFLRVGGDSVGAMRLVAAVRSHGMALSVADVLGHPRLSEMAKVVGTRHEAVVDEAADAVPVPFTSLDTEDVAGYLEQVIAPQLSIGNGNMVDVLPTTDFQKLAIRDALRDGPPARWSHFVADIADDMDFDRLERACLAAVESLDILRMIFIAIDDGLFWQVLVDKLDRPFVLCDNRDGCSDFVARICQSDLQKQRVLGQSFVQFLAVQDCVGGNKLIFRSSHAQYDGFSRQTVFDAVFSVYHGTHHQLPARAHFTDFLAYTARKKPDSLAYWKSRMRGSRTPNWTLPEVASPTDQPRTWTRVTVRTKIPSVGSDVSTANLIHAAVALALSRSYSTSEVVFGRLVTGRAMLPSHLQATVGPCLTELPVRVRISREDTLETVAVRLQRQFIRDSYFEAVGMAEILRECTDWPPATTDSFGWRSTVQPDPAATAQPSGERWVPMIYERLMPPRPRPEITSWIFGEEVELRYASDSCAVPYATVDSLLGEIRSILED